MHFVRVDISVANRPSSVRAINYIVVADSLSLMSDGIPTT